MLHLKPHGEADDSSRINIVSNLAQKIQGHVKVGQSEKWEFDYVWQVKVNGQPFTLKRTLRHTQTPQVLTGI
jgi:hypothetical protein